MKNAIVSIIVPIYNVDKYINKCINSIINQTYKNLEIILIDDGSSDNCPKICEEYAKKDSRIKVIHIKNKGVSSARNIGIKEANGQYLTFCDADDFYEKDAIELLKKHLEQNKVDLSICDFFESDCNYENIKPLIDKNNFFKLILEKNKFRGFLWNKLYKTSIAKKIKFNENIHICEDLLFNCQYMLLATEKVSIINNKLYHYAKRKDSALHKKTFDKKRMTSIIAYDELFEIYQTNHLSGMSNLYLNFVKELSILLYLSKGNKKYHKEIIKKGKVIIKRYSKCNSTKKNKLIALIYYKFYFIIQPLRKILKKE